ncbi:MAG: DUF1232 domain-containing protein [Patescibacteria group bacterium]|nr:DUF1232 domain-containing protein [Patescibacteria group bacterium]
MKILHILYSALRDKEIAWYYKTIFILVVLIYIISPIDAIPDVVPVLGFLDDLAIIPLAAYIALLLIPDRIKKP